VPQCPIAGDANAGAVVRCAFDGERDQPTTIKIASNSYRRHQKAIPSLYRVDQKTDNPLNFVNNNAMPTAKHHIFIGFEQF